MTRTSSQELWFDRPATRWLEALPLGNGRLGVMVHGGVEVEHLQVNDGTAWSGSVTSEREGAVVGRDAAAAAIAAARAAVGSGDLGAAARAVQALQHRHTQAYLPFVDLRITSGVSAQATVRPLVRTASAPGVPVPAPGVPAPATTVPVPAPTVPVPATETEVTHYRRSLDLATATSSVTYRLDGYEVRRSVVVSHPHEVAVMTIDTEHPAGLDVSLTLSSLLRVTGTGSAADATWMTLRLPSDVGPTHDASEDPVRYSDDPAASLAGACAVSWVHDGRSGGSGTGASGVHHATIVLATRTTFVGIARPSAGTADDVLATARARVSAALADGVGAVRRAHRADHARLFDRVTLSTGAPPLVDLPIDERLRRALAHPAGALAADPALAGLLFALGRYLLIASSRPGGLPANLQGLWNDQVQAPWSANYTTNINLEMNYWQAEVANLAELAEPLFDLVDALAITGAATAERLYGAPGWVAHHNTDPWAYSQPVGAGTHDPSWAFWPLAGPWLIRHLWEHVLFGADDAFARRAWAPIRSSAEFFLHWLVEMPDGSWGTTPSTSPENLFLGPDGRATSVDASSTMDLVLIADLFRIVGALADRLGLTGDPVVERAAAALPRIPGPVPGRDGMIAEWRADRPQADPAHRHVSHLVFAYPGDLPLTPELRAGVGASLDGRGDDATGWSLMWKIALRARLRQPDRVADLLRLVFRSAEVEGGGEGAGLYPNLFAAHPPFQIDGNLGFVAALGECLVQSHAGVIELLPAVPRELATGAVTGLVARPGVEVDLTWEPGDRGGVALTEAVFEPIRAAARGRHRIVWNGVEVMIDLGAGPVRLEGSDFAG